MRFGFPALIRQEIPAEIRKMERAKEIEPLVKIGTFRALKEFLMRSEISVNKLGHEQR